MKHEEGGVEARSALSAAQRELAGTLDRLASTPSFEVPALPAETASTAPMFERLRRRRGVARRWRWRRYLNRDRNAVVVEEP